MAPRIRLPDAISHKVKAHVFSEADKFNYCAKDRIQNGDFILRLVTDPAVGGVLGQFYPKDRIKTYIKDGILNAYVKERLRATRPKDIDKVVHRLLHFKVVEVDSEPDVTLLKAVDSAAHVVVAEGTYLKWETALRKALLYSTGKPFSNGKVYILLVLNACGKPIPLSDKKHLELSLKAVAVVPFIHSEP